MKNLLKTTLCLGALSGCLFLQARNLSTNGDTRSPASFGKEYGADFSKELKPGERISLLSPMGIDQKNCGSYLSTLLIWSEKRYTDFGQLGLSFNKGPVVGKKLITQLYQASRYDLKKEQAILCKNIRSLEIVNSGKVPIVILSSDAVVK